MHDRIGAILAGFRPNKRRRREATDPREADSLHEQHDVLHQAGLQGKQPEQHGEQSQNSPERAEQSRRTVKTGGQQKKGNRWPLHFPTLSRQRYVKVVVLYYLGALLRLRWVGRLGGQ